MKNCKFYTETIGGAIIGNDSVQSKPKGFGTPIADAKSRLYAKKKPGLLSDTTGITIGISGNDAVPETNSIAPDNADNTDEIPTPTSAKEADYTQGFRTERLDRRQGDRAGEHASERFDGSVPGDAGRDPKSGYGV